MHIHIHFTRRRDLGLYRALREQRPPGPSALSPAAGPSTKSFFAPLTKVGTPGLGAHRGITALVLGWQSPWTVAWLTNIPLFIGAVLLMLKKDRFALACGVAAVMLGFSTWALFEFDDKLMRLLAGYYLWQVSLLALVVGAGIASLRTRKRERTTPPQTHPRAERVLQ